MLNTRLMSEAMRQARALPIRKVTPAVAPVSMGLCHFGLMFWVKVVLRPLRYMIMHLDRARAWPRAMEQILVRHTAIALACDDTNHKDLSRLKAKGTMMIGHKSMEGTAEQGGTDDRAKQEVAKAPAAGPEEDYTRNWREQMNDENVTERPRSLYSTGESEMSWPT